jgi:hypothetical protein
VKKRSLHERYERKEVRKDSERRWEREREITRKKKIKREGCVEKERGRAGVVVSMGPPTKKLFLFLRGRE